MCRTTQSCCAGGKRTPRTRWVLGATRGGVSELVSNAIAYGEPPVTLRAWSSPGSVVVTVDDCGVGIDDPLAGLITPTRKIGTGGLGLWVTRQLCNDVAVMNLPNGFRVRIRRR